MPDFNGSPIDHVNLAVSDLDRARAFYEPTLAAIGYEVLLDIEAERTEGRGRMLAFGVRPKPFFWLLERGRVGEHTHVAFAVADRAGVEAFHAAGLAAGGTDNGAPGIRSMYHPGYYGAFLLDPDGINVEAVVHEAAG